MMEELYLISHMVDLQSTYSQPKDPTYDLFLDLKLEILCSFSICE